jgi:hypothetical protein
MQEANTAGKLSPGLRATCFTTPRPGYELYDLEADSSELNKLGGKPELREDLARKMALDFDYLPLPALMDDAGEPVK